MEVFIFSQWIRAMYDAALWRHRTIVDALYPEGPQRDRAWQIHKDFTDWVYAKEGSLDG